MSKKSQSSQNQNSVNQDKPRPPRRFQIQFDIEYGGTQNEVSGKSQTVPDMNLTVRQLLNNHTRGLSNDRHMKDPLYFDIQIPKITDITDVESYRDHLEHQMSEVNTFIEKEEAETIRQKNQEKAEQLQKQKITNQLDIETEIAKQRDNPKK